MDLSIAFLGTGGSIPTAQRATACLLIRAGGARIMIDCGEGSQRQMVRSTGLTPVDEIYLTHYHADHYLGLPGLLKTYDLQGRERPLRVLGPRGLGELFKALARIFGRLSYELELVELEPGESVEHEDFAIHAFAVEHRITAFGYALVEPERPGRFDPDRAAELGVSDVRDYGRLQRGEAVEVNGGSVDPGQVLGEPRPGRKLVVGGDSAPCEMTRVAAHEAELLIHDGSFATEEATRAAKRATPQRVRRASWPATPRSRCSPSSTSPRATTFRRCSRRLAPFIAAPTPRGTSTSSRFPTVSEVSRG